MADETKILLDENEIPRSWYNIVADLPNPPGRGPSLLQQEGRYPPPRHRDRRRPVGQLSRLRLPALRSRVHRVHGEGLVRAEAVPPLDDARLWRGSPGKPH